MTTLSHTDRAFLERRRARRTFGLYVLPIVLLLLVGAWGAFYAWWPMAINPFTVGDHFANASDTQLTMSALIDRARLAALLLNVSFALLVGAVVVCIGFAHVERRYRKLVDSLSQPAPLEKPKT